MNKQNIILSAIFFLLFTFLCQTCMNSIPPKFSAFEGEPGAIEKAEAMFTALGGKEGWANLKSLYIKALHEEPGLEYPYESHIWRDLDDFKMRIEQRGPVFDVIGLFSEKAVEIQYLHRDSMRWFSEEALAEERYGHDHNVYVLFKKLATQQGIEVRNGVENRIEFFQNDTLLCAFGLDEQNRPHRFFHPNLDGSESASLFKFWNTIDGLTHPAGGGPTDGNFSYKTEVWQPSHQNIEAAFEVAYRAEPFEFSDLDWLLGKWVLQQKDRSQYEVWHKVNDTTLIGEGYILTLQDSIFSEGLALTQHTNDLVYTATIPNQNEGKPIDFKWLGTFENRSIFLNPIHDFPQKIVYQKVGMDSLAVKVSGTTRGQWQTLKFIFKKST